MHAWVDSTRVVAPIIPVTPTATRLIDRPTDRPTDRSTDDTPSPPHSITDTRSANNTSKILQRLVGDRATITDGCAAAGACVWGLSGMVDLLIVSIL
jgi:hypothetical protein